MFVRLETDYEIRNGEYFETIKSSADQCNSKPSKIAPISFGALYTIVPRSSFFLFVLQNIAGYKNAVEYLLQ